MGARVYAGAATPTTLSGSITNVSTSGTITVATNWLTSGQFSIVVDPGLAGEEKILCTLSGTTLTFITRGYDGTTAASHNSGAVVYPVPTAIDFSEANTHVNASSAVHGLAGSVVGTTDTQTLTNKDLTDSTNKFNWPSVAGKNAIINGGMDIWQRGTSFTSVTSYTADRWNCSTVGTTINLTVTQDTSVPNSNSKYSIKYQQVTTGATSVTEYCTRQPIEQSNILPLFGKSCVVSFWYKSNKTGSHGIRIIATPNTGGLDQATTFTVFVADTWEYKTVAVTVFGAVTAPSAAPTAVGGYLDIGFRVGGAGAGFTTISANDYFQFAQVQLELGSTATTFSRAGGSIGGELAACQRYLPAVVADGTTSDIGSGFCYSTTNAYIYVPFKVTPRVPPTGVTVSSGSNFAVRNISATLITSTSVSINSGALDGAGLIVTVAAGLISGNGTTIVKGTTGSLLFTGCEL